MVSLYVFLLGLASGIALLAITAYRHVSPAWLKWLLIAMGLFVLSRYVAMACFTTPDAPQRVWPLRYCWFATSVGLTLPSVLVIDQLLRHPAMSPKKLLIWFCPFLLVHSAVILFGDATPVPDRIVGWMPRLSPFWQGLLSLTQAVFVIGFVGICLALVRKFRSRPIQTALLWLAMAHVYLGVDGVLLAMGRWYVRPFLFSEMLTLLALWHAYDTSARLQREPISL